VAPPILDEVVPGSDGDMIEELVANPIISSSRLILRSVLVSIHDDPAVLVIIPPILDDVIPRSDDEILEALEASFTSALWTCCQGFLWLAYTMVP
jgi:hypothetical protein